MYNYNGTAAAWFRGWLFGWWGLLASNTRINPPSLPLRQGGEGFPSVFSFKFAAAFLLQCLFGRASAFLLFISAVFSLLLCVSVVLHSFCLCFCVLGWLASSSGGPTPPQRCPYLPMRQWQKVDFSVQIGQDFRCTRCTRNVAFNLFLHLQQGISGFRKYTQTAQ